MEVFVLSPLAASVTLVIDAAVAFVGMAVEEHMSPCLADTIASLLAAPALVDSLGCLRKLKGHTGLVEEPVVVGEFVGLQGNCRPKFCCPGAGSLCYFDHTRALEE